MGPFLESEFWINSESVTSGSILNQFAAGSVYLRSVSSGFLPNASESVTSESVYCGPVRCLDRCLDADELFFGLYTSLGISPRILICKSHSMTSGISPWITGKRKE